MTPRAEMSGPPRASVLLLYGDDELALAEQLAERIARFDDPAASGVNLARFSAQRLDLEALATHLLSPPFLAPHRVAVLDLAPVSGRGPALPDRLFRLLETMPDTSILIAVAPTQPSQGKAKRGKGEPAGHAAAASFLRWVTDHPERATAREHRLPRGAAFEKWAIERARAYGATIEAAAAARLREVTGEDTRTADQELRKLAAYVDGARPIGVEDLRRLTPFRAEADIFAMVESVGGRDGRRAIGLVRTLLETEDPRYVFSMIVRQFRLLLLARDALDRGRIPRQILAEPPHRLPAFVADKVGRQAAGFRTEQLADIYRQLLALDIASKTGHADLGTGLETLVAALAR